MGATWAGVHVRGVSSADLEAAVLRWAREEGLARVADGEAEDPRGSRRILLLPADGWVTLCDEDAELDEDLNLAHAERLSRFLAPLAPEVAESDWRVRGDYTFPEDTIVRLANFARIPDAGAGARYLWADPAVVATRLVFRTPVSGEQRPVAEETGPTVLSLRASSLTARTGLALSDLGVFQASVESGAPHTGAQVLLEGTALALLEIRNAMERLLLPCIGTAAEQLARGE